MTTHPKPKKRLPKVRLPKVRLPKVRLPKVRLTVEQLEARRVFAGLWSYVDNSELPTGLPSFIRTEDFKLTRLDSTALRGQLAAAPASLNPVPTESSILSVPKPDGTLERFSIFVSSIMALELAAKFPEIQTYAGQGIDNPASTIRLDLTPQGFHAQVLSPNGTYYVDPYSNLPSDFYAVYAKGSAKVDLGFQELEGIVNDDVHDVVENKGDDISTQFNPSSGPALPRSGNELRTYRTAVAATGEYTQFHGGTVALGQAAIVTAMNRLTGIYQTELSIAFQLVADNDRLVFTDANTDGYTNNDGFAMLSENQTRVDSIIGNANYDIGHVFSTGGGGVASLGSVGINAVKARGVTGLPTPIGDAFYVDFVSARNWAPIRRESFFQWCGWQLRSPQWQHCLRTWQWHNNPSIRGHLRLRRFATEQRPVFSFGKFG